MILKVVNSKGIEKSWTVNSVTNRYQVVEGNHSRLYNFWFKFNALEISQEVFEHIACSNKFYGDHPTKMTVIDDDGNESENLIPITNNGEFRAIINQDDMTILYVEIRDMFNGMEVLPL